MRKKKWIGLLLLGTTALAGALEKDKQLAKSLEEQGIRVETAKPGVALNGFVDAGYSYNFNGRGTTNIGRRAAQDNGAKGDINLNALALSFDKALPEANEFAAGFHVDLIYREDGGLFGFEGAARGENINFTYGNKQALIPGNPLGVMASYVVNDQIDLQLGIVKNYGGVAPQSDPYHLIATQVV